MISFKPGALLNGVTVHCLRGMAAAAEIFERYGHDFVVTSVRDGRHMRGSKHYEGNAFDCRIHGIPDTVLQHIIDALRVVLGMDWDVVLEAKGTPNQHIHCERDPK